MAKNRISNSKRSHSLRVASFDDAQGFRRIWDAVFEGFIDKKKSLDLVVWIVDSDFGDFKVVCINSKTPPSDELPTGPRESISFTVANFDPDRFLKRIAVMPRGKKLDQAIQDENARIVQRIIPTIRTSFAQVIKERKAMTRKDSPGLGVYIAKLGSLSTVADSDWIAGAHALDRAVGQQPVREQLKAFATRHDYNPMELFGSKQGKLEAICLLPFGQKVTDKFVREFEKLAGIFKQLSPKFLRILGDPSLGSLNVKITDSQINRLLAVIPTAKLQKWNEAQADRYLEKVQAMYIANEDKDWLPNI